MMSPPKENRPDGDRNPLTASSRVRADGMRGGLGNPTLPPRAWVNPPARAVWRIASTAPCPPAADTSRAVHTCSLLDNRAGMESEVAVPAPYTAPPVANALTLSSLSAPTTPATLFHKGRMPSLYTVSIRKLIGFFAESRMPFQASLIASLPVLKASLSQSTPSITFSKAGLMPFSQMRVMCPLIQFHTGLMTRSLNQLKAPANAPRMKAIARLNRNFVSVHQRVMCATIQLNAYLI